MTNSRHIIKKVHAASFHFSVYKAAWKEMDMASYSPLLNETEKESLSYSILCVCERQRERNSKAAKHRDRKRQRFVCVADYDWLVLKWLGS